MGDDISAIEEWAKIFTEPEKLAETVGENYLAHHEEATKDIEQEKSDWAAGNDFDAGKDMADLVTLLLGPIEPNY